MARNLALDYKEAPAHDGEGAAFDKDGASTSKKDGVSTSDMECFSSTSAEACRKFDRVLYLKCGSGADWVTKRAELLDMIPEARNSGTATTDVESQLIQFLEQSRNFIIFDDVWDEPCLNGMVKVCGKHTKVLITAQDRNLSDVLTTEKDPFSISMDQIVPEESLRIFMALTGFFKDDTIILPEEDVKKCMIQLSEKVGGHPHALASFAAVIHREHKETLPQWHDVIDTYEKYFDDTSRFQHPPALHGVSYEQSVFDAIQVKFERLGEQERRIIVLMALFRGPLPIREAVVQYLHQALDPYWPRQHRSSDRRLSLSMEFRSARKRLEDLQWIKTRDDAKTKLTSWSIHSLDEHFIQLRRGDYIQEAMGILETLPTVIGQGPRRERQLNAALLVAASYFKDDFGLDIYTRLCSDYLWAETTLRANGTGAVESPRQTREEGSEVHSSETPNLRSSTDLRSEEPMSRSRFKNAVKKVLTILARRWNFRVRIDREDSIPVILAALTNNIRDGWSQSSQISAQQMLFLVVCHCLKLYDLSEKEKYGFGDALKNTLDSSLSLHQWIILLEGAQRNSWWISKDCMLSILGLSGRKHLHRSKFKSAAPLVSYEQMKVLLVLEDISSRFNGLCALDSLNIAPVLLKVWISPNCGLHVKCFTAAYFLRCLRDHGRGFFEDHQVNGLLDYAKQTLASTGTEGGGFERIAKLWSRASLRSLSRSCEELCSIRILVGFLLLIFVEADRHHDVIASGLQQMFTQSCPSPTKCWCWTRLLHFMASLSSKQTNRDFNVLMGEMGYLPQIRIYLKDWDGALEDLGKASKSDGLYCSNPDKFWFREQGTVKRMMGDLSGAVEDLDKAFELEAPDYNNYEVLKQRGYVKFLMSQKDGARGDEEDSARADAEEALLLQPSESQLKEDKHKYYSTSIVEYLGYQL